MSLRPLLDGLKAINDCQTELLHLAEQKTNLIMKDDTDGLNRLMQQESRLIQLLKNQEDQRSDFVDDYLKNNGIQPKSTMTMGEFIRLVTNLNDKLELQDLQQQLVRVTDQLKKHNERNQQLIQQSLDFIAFSLELMTDAEIDEATYQNPSHTNQTYKNRRLFDTKA